MLWINNNIENHEKFRNIFRETFDMIFLDLSKVPSSHLADEVNSIVTHHSNCCVFLGYLEPGWMLEPSHQTRIRKLFRKFPVAMTINFVESLPFSWKNEIHTLYTESPLNKNGKGNTLNNGSSVQEQSQL
jgi:hypothetical protein